MRFAATPVLVDTGGHAAQGLTALGAFVPGRPHPFNRVAPVSLAMFKADPLLQHTFQVRQGRLSVTPLTAEQHAHVVALGG